ncbi:MAG: DmsC/YnfH family molybdoenzyme membrane anchor subunit [Raoultibacter sp.]
MDQAIAELPLALFTTLAPVGMGAFILLAIAFFTVRFSDDELKRIDKMTAIPLALVLIGFAFSFLYLANPQNELSGVLGGGSLPLSSEMIAGVIAFLLAAVYWVFALTGRMSTLVRKVFCTIVAVAGGIFSFFVGLAYVVPTVISWYVIFPPFETLGFSVLGGVLFGTFVLSSSNTLFRAKSSSMFKIAATVAAAVGFFLGIGVMFLHLGYVDTLSTALVSGTELVAGVVGYTGIFVVCLFIALALEIIALYKSSTTLILGLGLAWGMGGILIARLVFYAIRMSSGV